jgi:predicted dehydrogenase
MRIDHIGNIYLAKNGEREWTAIEVDLGQPVEGVADTGFARGFMRFAPEIVDALRKGETAIIHAATFEDGLKVQHVLDAARRSNEAGCAVRLI